MDSPLAQNFRQRIRLVAGSLLRFLPVAVLTILVIGIPYTFLFEATSYVLTLVLAGIAGGATYAAVSFGRITHEKWALAAGLGIALGIVLTGYSAYAQVSQWNFDQDVAEEYERRHPQQPGLSPEALRREMLVQRFGPDADGGFWDHISQYARTAVIDWKWPSSKPHRNILFPDYRSGGDIWFAWFAHLLMFLVGCGVGALSGAERARWKQHVRERELVMSAASRPNGWNEESFEEQARRRYGPDPAQMLRYAIRQGDRKLFDLALTLGASPFMPLDDGELPANCAAAFSNDSLQWLKEAGAALLEPDAYGWNPLHIAVALGQLENVRRLLNWGVDANSRDHEGRTPLHGAFPNLTNPGIEEIVEGLLRHGADPSAEDVHGETPLMRAASSQNLVAVRMLVDAGARLDAFEKRRGWSVLAFAAAGDAVEVLEYLLQIEPAALQKLDRDGETLAAAVEHLALRAVEFLLRRGARADKARLLEILYVLEYDRPAQKAPQCRALLERYLPGQG